MSNGINNTKNNINIIKSKTIRQYYKLLKYSKYYMFNETEINLVD